MKMKHYAQPNDHLTGFRFDNFLLEIFAGIICSVFAVAGYKAGILLLFIPTGLVALICIVLVIHTIYSFVRKWIKVQIKNRVDSK
ncbi:hypothetical protein [Thalassomonas sp. M1454]|uniref:hypothetical protein n=1 Tax=Thalassomonas sp. M1454 TaxID=2594477 RepID=UPI00117DA677|nr:hypothetical protein [Thalassomonas sp. M1454]TRX56834.1 hypothetical protein FNN08_04760 [Thalassomonas sp. M1454]